MLQKLPEPAEEHPSEYDLLHKPRLVTALAPVIEASKIAHHATEHDLTLKEAALELGIIDGQTFDRRVDREPPLLVVALAFVAALGTLAISLFWPYVISFVMERG